MRKISRLRLFCAAIIVVGCCLTPFYKRSEPPTRSTLHVTTKETATTTTDFALTAHELSKNERFNAWKELTPNLPICYILPRHCEKMLTRRGMYWVGFAAPAAKMRQDIMGGLLSLVALICVGVGIFFSSSSYFQNESNGQTNASKAAAKRAHEESLKHGNCFQRNSAFTKLLSTPMNYWTGTSSFTFTSPETTFKLFIAVLLFADLNGLNEQSVLATPEVVALYRSKPDNSDYDFAPRVADWFMPSLNDQTADWWVECLSSVRSWLLLSWMAYLLLPARFTWASGICYVVGASAYVYLGAIAVVYCLAHRLIGTVDFILFSIPAVPFLGSPQYGPNAARWLRRFLYLCILVPIYLFSGVSKFRYKGLLSNLSGQWLTEIFDDNGKAADGSVLPTLFLFIGHNRLAAMMISWGSIAIGLILPLATVLWMEDRRVRLMFHVSCVAFHVSIFALLGPNFFHYCLLNLLASDPLGWSVWRRWFGQQHMQNKKSTNQPFYGSSQITWRDWMRLLVAFWAICGWFQVNFLSDTGHLAGNISSHRRRDPYILFSEFSIVAIKSTDQTNYTLSLFMVTMSAIVYAYVIFFRGSEPQNMSSSSYQAVSTAPAKKDIVDAKKLPLKERMDLAREGPTLVFDGVCNLCNGSMSWFQQRVRDDSPVWYMWAQHPDTHAFLEEIGISRQDILTSWAYIDNGIVYRGSIAWIMALANLIAPWRYFSAIGKLFPAFIREKIYKIVAANRYNALGHSDACQRPNPAMKARFLHNTFVPGGGESEIPPVQKKRLLVIGCGPAGLMVAKKLAKSNDFAVTVVEPKDYYEFTPGILRGMCDPASMKDLVFKLEPVLCDDLGMGFVQGIVTELGSHKATVKRIPGGTLRQSSGQVATESLEDPNVMHIEFDYCVVAAGSQYTTSRLWKVQSNLQDDDNNENAFRSFTMEGRKNELAEEHRRLKQMNEQRKGAVSIMGAGLVGVELAAEIRHFFPNIPTVKLFDPMPTVLPTMPDSAQNCTAQWMREHNVDLVLGDSFGDAAVAQAERESDVVYRCVGVATNVGFLPSNVLDNKRQVRVNAAMQIVAKDDTILFGGGRIFALGDCAAVEGAPPLAKDIYPAEAMGSVVIANLRQALTVQCMQTRPGILWELNGPLMVMNLCSLGPDDCVFTMNGFTILRGKPASFIKDTIQYTKMSDSRNEFLGTAIWSSVPHF